MFSRCKLVGLLTSRQLDIVKRLNELSLNASPTAYWKPRDLGSFKGSHHAKTLTRLEAQGLVERIALAEEGKSRPHFLYRITDQGRETLELFKTCVDVQVDTILGGNNDRRRAKLALRMAA